MKTRLFVLALSALILSAAGAPPARSQGHFPPASCGGFIVGSMITAMIPEFEPEPYLGPGYPRHGPLLRLFRPSLTLTARPGYLKCLVDIRWDNNVTEQGIFRFWRTPSGRRLVSWIATNGQ